MMVPGEILVAAGEIVLNEGRDPVAIMVANTGDRPIQVGSHYHFVETNAQLKFDRAAAYANRGGRVGGLRAACDVATRTPLP